MKEILPGVFHWITFHEGIKDDVHSYLITGTDPPVVIDPRVPDEGLEWFQGPRVPRHAFLTNRHHYRHSGRFIEAFGLEVWCHEDGLHEFTKGEKVRPFRHGDQLPGGILALPIGTLCPEETALCIPVGGGVLSIGDAIVHRGGRLGFVPDFLIGDDPEPVKRGIKAAFRNQLDRPFDHLLFAHGEPIVGGGKETLRRFVEG